MALSSRAWLSVSFIETFNALETDAFINTLRHSQAERGPVRQIRFDCG